MQTYVNWRCPTCVDDCPFELDVSRLVVAVKGQDPLPCNTVNLGHLMGSEIEISEWLLWAEWART